MKKIICVILVLGVLVPSAFSFDGNRKGFVLGGGVGFSPYSKWSTDSPVDRFLRDPIKSESSNALGWHLGVGYGIDDKYMFLLEWNAVGWDSHFWNQTMFQDFLGVSIYRYFGPPGKSVFYTLGAGMYGFEGEKIISLKDDELYTNPRFGFKFGGGYSFSKHWQVGAYCTIGKSGGGDRDFNLLHTNVLVSGFAF